jgi:FMN-dependent oxidoreductase (nitrilotriacetate monooxygenase family)
LAQIAERGKLDAVFFADGHAVGNVADGSAWFLEPLTALAAISRATERIGLISIVSSTFSTPFHTARQLASLDHISGGRMGWNVVTSMFDGEARNHGYASMPAHAERYRRADEFVAVVLKLWDSWTDDALQWDRGGQYADPAKVRPIHHRGAYFRVDGPLNVPRPPQGHPVLFQAGASEQGRALAARRAEAIYAVAWDLPAAQAYYRDIKRRVQAAGRRAPVPIMPGLVPYVAATIEEAQAKQRELDALLPVAAALRQLGLFTAQDCLNLGAGCAGAALTVAGGLSRAEGPLQYHLTDYCNRTPDGPAVVGPTGRRRWALHPGGHPRADRRSYGALVSQ